MFGFMFHLLYVKDNHFYFYFIFLFLFFCEKVNSPKMIFIFYFFEKVNSPHDARQDHKNIKKEVYSIQHFILN